MNRIAQYLAHPCTGTYNCECRKCQDCELDQLAADSGWQKMGDGYYHPRVGTVKLGPSRGCETPEDVRLSPVEPRATYRPYRTAVGVWFVVGVVAMYMAALLFFSWCISGFIN